MQNLLRKYLLLFTIAVTAIQTTKASGDTDSLLNKQGNQSQFNAVEKRQFTQLNKLLNQGNYFASANAEPEFTDKFLQTYLPPDTGSVTNRAKAQQTLEEVERSNHYIDFISPNDLTSLPVGLKKKLGNTSVTIGISKAKFMSGYAELTVFCKLKLPQGKEIFFGADNIKLSHGGGLIGDANLVLLGDFNIPFNGGNLLLTLKGGQAMNYTTGSQYLTYAKLECGGIKEIGLAADVLFPKNMLVPLKADYSVNDALNARVKGSFSTIVTDWNDILAEFSMQPFAIKGFERFAIAVNRVVFDFSDVKNSPDVIFPIGYENLIPGNEQLWRGVYVNKLQIILPKEFKKRGTTQRVSFEANNMLVDNLGLTGNFAANGILQSGSASGWEFSVDKFAIDIKANHLKGAGFEGYIGIPLQKKNSPSDTLNKGFGYKAIISPGNQYLMRVNTLSNIKFDIWQATAQIDSGSYVELLVRNDQFKPKAVLNGGLNVQVIKSTQTDTTTNVTKSITTIKGIVFQQLVLQTEAPYIQADYFGYKGEAKLANFPISLYDIGLTANNRDAAIGFGVNVNLMKGKITAGTHLKIVGEMVDENETYHYAYKRIDIDELQIGADFSGFKMNGYVLFNRNHPIMGNGFEGALKMTVKIGSPITIDAKAAFGSKPLEPGQTETFRYWYVDAMATGLHFSTGAINITGLGGGASYHMQKRTNLLVDTSVSPTKMGYIPNENMGLGLKAMVAFNVGTNAVCKGEAGLEMMFTSSGGMANIGLFGKAYFMPSPAMKAFFNNATNIGNKLTNNLTKFTERITGTDSADYASKTALGKFTDVAKGYYPVDSTIGTEGQISAFAGISYDFQNKILHANLDLYVNVAGGIIRGRASGGRAGWAVMHFAPDEWYIHLGTPTDRLGLKMGVGSISAESGGYFMVGSHIPGSPPPPPIVAQILGVSIGELDYMRDLNALGEGRGFAFGADFSINTGDLRFLMFYASFQAGLGFDIMLKDYGDAHCVGSNEPIGMNGWYANGQAYAYLQGELGIQVKLMFIKKKIPIIKAGAAVLLQAKLPNPSWFRGYVGGYFSVLGGLVKGRFRFKVTIGHECEIVGAGPLDGVKVIADFSPADKATQVDVFAAPQAVFNMPVEKPFTIDDDQGTKTYRIKLDEYNVTKDGQPIAGVLKWNSRNDAVMFESSEILPPNANIKAKVKVSFEQQSGSSWQKVYDNGQAAIEEKEISFTTGLAPDNIPLTNIAYSYPVVDQKFFYTKEYNKAYVQLKRGQAYLFNTPQYQQQAQFVIGTGTPGSNAFVYDSAAKKVNLNLPDLQTMQNYTCTLLGIPQGNSGDNINQQTQNINTDSNDVQVTNNKAGEVVTSDKPHSFLTYNFATSRYNTFKDKMAAKTMQHPIYEIILSDVGALQADINGQEAFDKTELSGSQYTDEKPLVQPIAILTDNWFMQDINPLIYFDYPPAANIIISRDTAELGLPPAKALDVMTWYEQMTESNPGSGILGTRLPHRYYLGYHYKMDFSELQYKVVNQYVNNPNGVPANLYRFITSSFPLMKSGKYKVQYRYILPGNIQGGVYEFEFENPVQ